MSDERSAPRRVLFVCIGNSCRSVLAEYLGRRAFGNAVTFESAGIKPQNAADAKDAVCTLKKNFGIDASNHVPRDVRSLDLTKYDLIIGFEKSVVKVVEELGVSPSRVELWKVRDPWGDDLTEYEEASVEIQRYLRKLKALG